MSEIVTLTMNPAIDTSTKVDIVEKNEKLRCEKPVYEPGGGGLNVSRALANMGANSIAVYVSGGTKGIFLDELIQASGVQTRPIRTKGETRENLTIRETGTGRNDQFRFGMPGPELEDSEWQAAIESVRESVQSGGIVVASGSLPPGVPDDFYGRLEDALSPKDVRLLVDTSGGPLRSALSSGVYLIKPNYPEFARLVGASDLVESDITEKARGLVEGGSASVIAVSLGAGGALVVSADAAIRLHSPTVSIKSRIGAGDSMMAGLALGMNRGMPLEDIARLGLAAGAAAVMTPGTELCRGEDVERLFGELQDSD